ncbi:MAG: DNA recombination protein RmuC [Planctomycetota bacterium]
MDIASLLTGLLIGGLLGAMALAVRSARTAAALHEARERLAQAEAERAALRSQSEQHAAQLQESQLACARSEERAAAAQQLDDRCQELTAALREREAEVARMGQELDDQRRMHREKLAELTAAREELANQFKATATSILSETRSQVTKEHQERLDLVLKPFAEHLERFRKQVHDTHDTAVRERLSLKEQIKHLSELNQRMDTDARALTQALTGQSKVRGDWGEMVLERILQQSGLRKGEEYRTQESFTDGEDGSVRRPDVLVTMPNDQCIVIDSKLQLIAWVEFTSAEDEPGQAAALKSLCTAVRAHVQNLAGKEYQQIKGLKADDYVLLFIPIDAAFLEVSRADPQLFEHAYQRGVVLVCPSTLMATLRSIASAWRYERQQRNALKIAEEGGRLHDAVLRFLKSYDEIGQRLSQATAAYERGRERLQHGKGNLIRRTERLRHLGVSTAKRMGVEWREANDDQDEVADAGEE